MKAANLSVRDLARKVDIAHPTLYNWITGNRQPRNTNVWQPIAAYFGVPFEEFMDPSQGVERYVELLKNPAMMMTTGTGHLPLWQAVPCGDWQDPGEQQGTKEVPSFLVAPNRIVVPVKGDSMEDYIHEDDFLVVQLDKRPRFGRVSLVKSDHQEVTCKIIRRDSRGAYLQALNAERTVAHREELQVAGYLVAILRDWAGDRGTIIYDNGGLAP